MTNVILRASSVGHALAISLRPTNYISGTVIVLTLTVVTATLQTTRFKGPRAAFVALFVIGGSILLWLVAVTCLVFGAFRP
jgi:hypothetical protein